MTMLDIFKERMPQGMEVVKIKETGNYYQLVLSYNGMECKTPLLKACAPGYAEKNCDTTICAVMMGIALDTNNIAMAIEWRNKHNALIGIK